MCRRRFFLEHLIKCSDISTHIQLQFIHISSFFSSYFLSYLDMLSWMISTPRISPHFLGLPLALFLNHHSIQHHLDDEITLNVSWSVTLSASEFSTQQILKFVLFFSCLTFNSFLKQPKPLLSTDEVFVLVPFTCLSSFSIQFDCN